MGDSQKLWSIDNSLSLKDKDAQIVPAFVLQSYQYKNIETLFKRLQTSDYKHVIINYKNEYILLNRTEQDMEIWQQVWEESDMRAEILFPETYKLQSQYNVWDMNSYERNKSKIPHPECEQIYHALEDAGVPDEWISMTKKKVGEKST